MTAPSIIDRLKYAYAAFKAGQAIAGAVQQVTAAIPASANSGGVMASVPLQTLEAVTSFLNSDPRAKTLIGLAQNLAGGEGVSFVDAIKAHDWSTVATDVLTEGLTAAAAFGVPGASIALKMIPVVIWAAKHPASVESAAMQKVTGDDGRPGANIAGGA